MDNDLRINISTKADTSGVDKTSQSLNALNKQSSQSEPFINRLNTAFAPLAGVTAGAGIALSKLTSFMGGSVTEASKLQNSLIGLNSIATAFHQDANRAKQAAQELAKDGLMTVSDSARGLKNLLASGFNLDQAITLMKRFKDSAAFARQGSLSFGEAVSSATEGIKNGNSILVDNAGVTKNLSVILEEAGFSAQDLMKATTDANIRQALFNGILKETNAQLGDANKLVNTYAGSQAKASAQTIMLKQQIGSALQVALLPLLQALSKIIVPIANWVEHHQKLAAAIGISMVIFLGLITVVGAIGLAIAALGPIIAAFGAAAVGVGVIVAGAFAVAAGVIVTYWNPIKAFFSSVVEHISNAVSGVTNALAGPFQKAWSIISPIIDKIKGAFDFVVNADKKIVDVGSNVAKGTFNKLKGLIPGFSTGVENFGGGLAYVHKGEVLANLPKGTDVIPARQVQQAAGGSQSTTTYNIQSVNLSTGAAVAEFFKIQDTNALLISKGLSPVRV